MTRTREMRPTLERLRHEHEIDPIAIYMRDVSRHEVLSADKERELALRVQAGDEVAEQQLIRANLRFVIRVASRYQNRGLPLADLVQEGNAGLITAVRKFDPNAGVKFTTYAVWWIRRAIMDAIGKQVRPIRLPKNQIEDLARLTKTQDALRQRLHREPTREQLAEATGFDVTRVDHLLELATTEVRLDAPVRADTEGGRSIADSLVQTDTADPEDLLMEVLTSERLDAALNALPEREATILKLYFGLEGGREYTLDEIGARLGVTRERVRQLRDRAIQRLRNSNHGHLLEQLLVE